MQSCLKSVINSVNFSSFTVVGVGINVAVEKLYNGADDRASVSVPLRLVANFFQAINHLLKISYNCRFISSTSDL